MSIWQQESEGDERAPRIVSHLDSLRPGPAAAVFKTLMAILETAYPKNHLQYVGLTEGWVEAFIEPLLTAFGETIRILHVVRDPRAVIASRNAGMNVEKKYGGQYPILFLIRQWRKGVATVLSQKEHEGYMVLRYEDLVTSPESVLGEVQRFLDLPADEAVLRIDRYVNGAGRQWKQNTSFKPGAGFSTSSVHRWKSVLDEREISLIESLCMPEMAYLGYELTTTGKIDPSVWDVAEKDEGLIEWLKPYKLTGNTDAWALEVLRRELLENGNRLSDDAAGYLFHDPKAYRLLRKEMERKRLQGTAAAALPGT